MNYLAIDTSGKNLTVIIRNGEKIYKYNDSDCGVNHSVDIMVVIQKLIEESKTDLRTADFISVVVGAGSFTGIRIGVSTAKSLCLAYNLPCLAITSFDVMAYNKEKGKYLAVIDAKHNGYYVTGYRDKKVVYPPSFIDGETLKGLACEYKLLSTEKIGLDTEIVSVVEGIIKAIEEKADLKTADMNEIVPLYIRKSQAEENR